ncbi:MAG: sugar ABC transporter substrate-binding protein, partial [Endomicrobia bacterium]|nr:sugar ABC transporter substrate-binding protein [Endomicrobiia bacterium]
LSSCAKKEVSGKKVIKIWVMPNTSRPEKDLKKVLEEYEKNNPDVSIEVTCMDWGAAWSKITTAATSGVGPDICQLGSTWVGTIASMDALLDLTKNFKDEMNKFVEEILPTSGYNNKVYAIPWILDVRAIFYRKDIFDKLKIAEKDLDTWESFEKTLEKISKVLVVSDEKGNIFVGKEAEVKLNQKGYFKVESFGITGKNDWNVLHHLSPWLWAGGGDWLSKDNRKCILDTPESYKGISFYMGLALKEYIPKSTLELNTYQVSTNFSMGKYIMYVDGPWVVRGFETSEEEGGAQNTIAADKYAVTLFPKGPNGRYTFMGSSNLVVFKSSKYPDEAIKIIKYLTSEKAQIEYCKVSGFLSPVKSVLENPYFKEHPARKKFKDSIKYGKVYPCIPSWGPLETVFTRGIGELWDYVSGLYGKFDEEKIKQHLKKLTQECDNVLATKK